MDKKSLDQLGLTIDRACDNNNYEELLLIISNNEEYVETLENSKIKTNLYYFLANCWGGLRNIKHQNDEKKYIWQYEQKELFKEIYYLRKAIGESGFDSFEIDLQISIYTNLANSFRHYGRTINALKYFNKALALHPNFFMALVNKAICFERYAQLIYDDGHIELLLRNAYFSYIKALDEINIHLENSTHDFEYYISVKSNVELSIASIENLLTKECLDENIDLNEHKLGQYKNEIKYRKWTLDNTLFLNPINDLGSFSIAAHDPLNLPSLTTKIGTGFPKYITYFNQIKQEFITNRYLLYEGLSHLSNKYYDKETSIINDYDYNIYDINTEKIKLSFKGFYSLFDKIAYFLNEYFKLYYNENHVDFKKIWMNKNNRKTLNSKLEIFENLALRGLYLISKDLYFYQNENDDNFIEALEPEAKKINEIRNHLEHKFIMIKSLDIGNDQENSEQIFYLTEDELHEKTIYLAQLAREAIIYLSLAVHNEERKKDDSDIFGEQCEIL